MKRFTKSIMLACTVLTGFSVAAKEIPQDMLPVKPQKNGGLYKTAAACSQAAAEIDLDINNVRARLMTGGDMWWDRGVQTARYEIPKGSRKNSLFAGSVWIGGYDADKNLKVAAQTYRQSGNDFWPGPLTTDGSASVSSDVCSAWDNFWKINKSDVIAFQAWIASNGGTVAKTAYDPQFDAIIKWPAKFNSEAVGKDNAPLGLDGPIYTGQYAPYVEVNGVDGYQWNEGDYPKINGDQYIWWIYNDKGNIKTETNTDGIGLEVQAAAFGFATNDALNDASFYTFNVINRGTTKLDSTFMSMWSDADLGYAFDDFVGCDTVRGLGILYNGDAFDGQGSNAGIGDYGANPPMIGVDFFEGPHAMINGKDTMLGMTRFTYFNNDNTSQGNPFNGPDFYRYMTGTWKDGTPFTNDCATKNAGVPSKYVFYDDPTVVGGFSECSCNKTPADRRFIHSSGPFVLEPGEVNKVTIGAVWVPGVGGCPSVSFKTLQLADDRAQNLFDKNFEITDGPHAPTVTKAELDKKVVLYLNNPVQSNNFEELYGTGDSAKYRVSSPKASTLKVADSLYKFEGYKIFQLKDSTVSRAQIYNTDGSVNTAVARIAAQCDLKNGITKIVNYEPSLEASVDPQHTVYRPIIYAINTEDKGVKHSFDITVDQFSTGADKGLVNYKNYYFIVVAYAYNNFASFDPANPDVTQTESYIESRTDAFGNPVRLVRAMPSSLGTDPGAVPGANYGQGVVIKRLEGKGNGSNSLVINSESEKEIFDAANNHQTFFPNYDAGHGPIDVKVVDPMAVKPAKFEVRLIGPSYPYNPTAASLQDTAKGMIPDSSYWEIVDVTVPGSPVTIITNASEINKINRYNERLLDKYGISVNIKQAARSGDEKNDGNGFISANITFKDTFNTWLGGVEDEESNSVLNWIRSGMVHTDNIDCDYSDYDNDMGNNFDSLDGRQIIKVVIDNDDPNQDFEAMLTGTWAPYIMASAEARGTCGFGFSYKGDQPVVVGTGNSTGYFAGNRSVRKENPLSNLSGVDIVMTSDRSKWTRVSVVEMRDNAQDNTGYTVAEGGALKFNLRKHGSLQLNPAADGGPMYDDISVDYGHSWFPGYAINVETGERLNMLIGEDSWLKSQNGGDMIWNPTSTLATSTGIVYGGKQFVYVLRTKYDAYPGGPDVTWQNLKDGENKNTNAINLTKRNVYNKVMWMGATMLKTGFNLLSWKDGLVPTETRVSLRANKPYQVYVPKTGMELKNEGRPMYSFSTEGLQPTKYGDAANPYTSDKQKLLDRVKVVPNPYYAFSQYEANRLDNRVRVINLPRRATVKVYTLDGVLVRKLDKDDATAQFIDWDLKNERGVPVASGMYLFHVKIDGVGETVVKWFGAMRPIDIDRF